MSFAPDSDFVSLPDAPRIAGLTFRRYRGPQDVPALTTVRAQAAAWDGVDPRSARESIPTQAEQTDAFSRVQSGDPNYLLAEMDGHVIGYNRVTWWLEEGDLRVYLHLGWLLPEWRGKGIGRTMLRAAEARCREIADVQPTGGMHTYATNASSTEREAIRLVLDENYTVVRRLSDMARSCSDALPADPSLPEGIAIRPLTSEHYPAIYHALKGVWAGRWGTTVESEEDYQEFLADHAGMSGFDPGLWQVAWADGSVAGFVLCHLERGVGVVSEVAVTQPWRRRGLARALLMRGLRAIVARSVPEARIYTDADDGQGARRLYESVGFRERKQHYLWRKPMA